MKHPSIILALLSLCSAGCHITKTETVHLDPIVIDLDVQTAAPENERSEKNLLERVISDILYSPEEASGAVIFGAGAFLAKTGERPQSINDLKEGLEHLEISQAGLDTIESIKFSAVDEDTIRIDFVSRENLEGSLTMSLSEIQKAKLEPGELVNASSAAGKAENHLHD